MTLLCRFVDFDVQWKCSNVYGPTAMGEKAEFWNELHQVGKQWAVPWLIFGDFNAIRTRSERMGQSFSRRESRDCNTFIDNFSLLEFDKGGPQFSFSNKQDIPTLSKIDRFLACVDWMETFPGLVEKSLCFFKSDHRVLLLKSTTIIKGRPKPFRFQPHWFEEPDLMQLIKPWWNEMQFSGNAGFVLHKKLKLLKGKIKAWVSKNLCKVEKKIESLEGLL